MLIIIALEALAMICYDFALVPNLGIGMTKNELFNRIEFQLNFYNKIVPDKICGTVFIEDLSIGMTKKELINNLKVLPSSYIKSVPDDKT